MGRIFDNFSNLHLLALKYTEYSKGNLTPYLEKSVLVAASHLGIGELTKDNQNGLSHKYFYFYL